MKHQTQFFLVDLEVVQNLPLIGEFLHNFQFFEPLYVHSVFTLQIHSFNHRSEAQRSPLDLQFRPAVKSDVFFLKPQQQKILLLKGPEAHKKQRFRWPFRHLLLRVI